MATKPRGWGVKALVAGPLREELFLRLPCMGRGKCMGDTNDIQIEYIYKQLLLIYRGISYIWPCVSGTLQNVHCTLHVQYKQKRNTLDKVPEQHGYVYLVRF